MPTSAPPTDRVSPAKLPRIRNHIVTHMDDPHTLMHEMADHLLDKILLHQHRTHVAAADLYWVTADMAALAVHAAGSLDSSPGDFAEHRPSSCGLMLMDGGIGATSDSTGDAAAIDAVTWGPMGEGQLLLTPWFRRSRLQAAAAALGEELRAEIPALFPSQTMIISPEPAAHTPNLRHFLHTIESAWLLMQQPTLVDRTAERADKGTRRRYASRNLRTPEVTVVNLRSEYRPDQDPDDTDQEPGRPHRYRWVVSGHWRNQPFGKHRAQRRRKWIPAYTKGPDGAPLLIKDRVNVWRR